MTPRLVYFDVETTGLDTATDRVVSIALYHEHEPLLDRLVDPRQPIPAEATAIHGITDAMVADVEPFSALALAVQTILDTADILVSYNGRRFDTLLLDAELRRAGQPGIDLDNVQEIDLYRVWGAIEPRTLAGAVMRFLGRTLNAHNARADAEVLSPLFQEIVRVFDLDLAAMLAMSKPADEVDRSGKFKRRDDGVIVFAFGKKHKGQPAIEHTDYLDWMRDADFPADTKRAIRRLLEGD